MEGEVEGVRQLDGELLRLLEVRNVAKKYHTLAYKARGVKGNPDGITNPEISSRQLILSAKKQNSESSNDFAIQRLLPG